MVTWLGALWIAAMVGPLPWAGAVAYRKLKAGTLSRRAGYWMTIGFELLYGLAALAYAALARSGGPVLPLTSPMAAPLGAWSEVVPGVLGGALIGLLLPIAVPRIRQKLLEQGGDVAALLPRTASERWLFAAVAISAGVCEELLYRGFLWHFLSLHLAVPLGVRMVIAALLFGWGHVYQGVRGVLGTAAIGAGMLVLFLVTGSLLLPIVLHALVDLRAIALAPRQVPEAV
jgi:membrane protease YdiL (CAAX protease family)